MSEDGGAIEKSGSELEPLPSRLKKVMYKGFYEGTKAEVAYMVSGNKIVFSATGKKEGAAPNTINGSTNVVKAICEQEGIDDWRKYDFYDFQTKLGGYLRHAEGNSTAFDRLVFDENVDYPRVKNWDTQFDTDLGIGVDAAGFQDSLLDLVE